MAQCSLSLSNKTMDQVNNNNTFDNTEEIINNNNTPQKRRPAMRSVLPQIKDKKIIKKTKKETDWVTKVKEDILGNISNALEEQDRKVKMLEDSNKKLVVDNKVLSSKLLTVTEEKKGIEHLYNILKEEQEMGKSVQRNLHFKHIDTMDQDLKELQQSLNIHRCQLMEKWNTMFQVMMRADKQMTRMRESLLLLKQEEPNLEDMLCQACLTNKKTVAFAPCGHLFFCKPCFDTYREKCSEAVDPDAPHVTQQFTCPVCKSSRFAVDVRL